jgi:hypothetical protein
VSGELAGAIARIRERARRATSPYLIQDQNGQPLTYFALRAPFDKARENSGVSFRFRDLRARAATDTGDLAHSQSCSRIGTATWRSTACGSRLGERVKPLR